MAEGELDPLSDLEAIVASQNRFTIQHHEEVPNPTETPLQDPDLMEPLFDSAIKDERRARRSSMTSSVLFECYPTKWFEFKGASAEEKATIGAKFMNRSIDYTNFVENRLAVIEGKLEDWDGHFQHHSTMEDGNGITEQSEPIPTPSNKGRADATSTLTSKINRVQRIEDFKKPQPGSGSEDSELDMYRRRTGRKHKNRTSSASGEVFIIDVLIAEAKASSERWTKKRHQKFPSNTDESPQKCLASIKVDELLRRVPNRIRINFISLLKILDKITGETQLPGVRRDRDI